MLLSKYQFRLIREDIVLITKAIQRQLVIPDWKRFCLDVEE